MAAMLLVLAGSPAFGQEFKLRFGGSDPGRGLLGRATLTFFPELVLFLPRLLLR